MSEPTRQTPEEESFPDINPLRRQVQSKIKKLELLASSGLWLLALFTLLSMGAYRNFDFLPTLSADMRALLGSGPSPNMINWALVVYAFSALIMLLTQMSGGKKPGTALPHFGYLGGFYAFYHLTNSLRENFWAIFVVGLTILGLQSYFVWNYYHEQIREQKEILTELDKLVD